jgi:hypothetical protein
MVVLIVNMERFEFRQRPGFEGSCFRRLIWGNVISSLLNRVYINSSTIRRHGGGIIDDWILYRYTRCFEVCRSLILNMSVPAPIYTLQASSFRPPLIRNKPDLDQRIQKHTQKPRTNLNKFYPPQSPPYNTTLLLHNCSSKAKISNCTSYFSHLPSPSNSSNSSNSRSQSRRNPLTHQHEPNIKQHNRSLGVSIPIPPRKPDKTKRGMRSF